MLQRKGNLKPAHAGYRYQDLVTAYSLAEGLVHQYHSVTANKKLVDDDRFDDLEIQKNEYRVRFQIKSSRDENRALQIGDFTGANSSLRIDRLVQTHTRAGCNAANEYRLCATWKRPIDNTLLSLLESADAFPTIASYVTYRCKLRGDLLWPLGNHPLWSWLSEANNLSRDDVLTFCDRFIIELELPRASETLLQPGPLENALLALLTAQVGIGRYPNKDRLPEDVAALLLAVATLSRTQEASLTPKEIEVQLGLRTDYGRVAQNFPLDKSIFQDRNALRPILNEIALRGEHQLVIGPPGAGKSWELTRSADELKEAGAIVARHYCYLEPGDELVERRITTDVLFGNLMAELIDVEPTLRDKSQQHYSAGLHELEKLLEHAVQLERPVVLIVDGIDHIARILSNTRSVTDAETDIVEQLATLNLPRYVALIVGSQPGYHLNPLRDALGQNLVEHYVQPWSKEDIEGLVEKIGVIDSFQQTGGRDHDTIIELLAERSEGNPLYATYLSRELSERLRKGEITDPEEWLRDAPIIDGDIAVYYAHLYEHASETAQAVADVLGVIDFGVSEADLREMLPGPLRGWITEARAHLRPILTSVSSQGGVRIFHESFRKFMTEELERRGRTVADVLQPVIDWLQRRGFYRDAKAYRFLLPSLHRASRIDEALALVGVTFLSESVAHGHPRDAVQRNLAIALNIASKELKWLDLIRYVELHRAIHTCYEEKMYDPITYWETYLDLFGPEALAERLLFDGRPTQNYEIGLLLCSLVDDTGATAPWREYLALAKDTDEEPEREEERNRALKERISFARLHGLIRVEGFDSVAPSILSFLIEHGERNAKPEYLRELAKRIARTAGREALESLIARGSNPNHAPRILSRRVIAILKLGLADILAGMSDSDGAKAVASDAIIDIAIPEFALDCIRLGASPTYTTYYASKLSNLSLDLNASYPEAESVRTWVTSIRLHAWVDQTALDVEMKRIVGEGWYRCWLRFMIRLAEVEVAIRLGRNSSNICSAFDELVRDVRPFAGKPRSVDLHSIRGIIANTLALGFSLLATEEDWKNVLCDLNTVLDGTSTYLDRSPTGPLPLETVLELLLPYCKNQIVGRMIREFAESEIANSNAIGTYFETHAEHGMILARILKAIGDDETARTVWTRIGVYLGGYGFRKDTTIYELIDSVPSFDDLEHMEAFKALTVLQPLSNALLRHTDGRETNSAQNAWFRSLLKCNPPTALALLAQSMNLRDATTGWPIETALHDALRQTKDIANARLLALIYAALPFEVEYENESYSRADERLAVVSRLLECDTKVGILALQHLAAQVTGDGQSYTDGSKARVQAFADERGITIPRIHANSDQGTKGSNLDDYPRLNGRDDSPRILSETATPFFPVDAKAVDLIASIRKAGEAHRANSQTWNRFVNAFGYRLVGMIKEGQEAEAIRLVRFFARSVLIFSDRNTHPLAEIGEGLERNGCNRVAAISYVLAYLKSRGGGGWHSIGDKKHEHLLLRGIALSRAEALEILATEIAYSLRSSFYDFGITLNLIQRMAACGEPSLAKNCWWMAYEVILHRLPTIKERVGWFERFNPSNIPNWSVNEGLVAVLLARINHPVLSCKIAALVGLAHTIKLSSEVISRPLHSFLTRDTPTSSVLLVLSVLHTVESIPYPITQALSEVLYGYASGEFWGARILSQLLLNRANLTVPQYKGRLTNLGVPALSEDETKKILSIDTSDRFDYLRTIWPDLSSLTARRFHLLFYRAESHTERVKERYELAFGRDGESRPPTPVMLWESELFETALHDELSGLDEYLWSSGTWRAGINDAVLSQVLPNIHAHLGLHVSRVVRPPYPNPESVEAGQAGILTLENDSLYPGWQRAAYVERHWIKDDKKPYSAPSSLVTVLAGAYTEHLGRLPQQNDFPFKKAEITDWWTQQIPDPVFPPQLSLGPLIRLVRLTDWLGDTFVLIPPIELRAYVSLTPPEFSAPLIWRSSDGEPAIVLRTWRVRDRHSFRTKEALEYEGLDLIMRPDIFSRMNQLTDVRVVELRVVWHNSLTLN